MSILKILFAFAFSLVCSLASATELRVLFFTQNGCPPCRQTEPGIDQLAQTGIAVSKYFLEVDGQYAAQCGVTRTPTVMVVQDNRVLARYSGAMSLEDLQEMVAPFRPLGGAQMPANLPDRQQPQNSPGNPSNPQSTFASVQQPGALSNEIISSPGNARLAPETLAMQATVRLRVEDAAGTGHATGTIIHRVENEALVLTCGHVFRDSKGTGTIAVDLGFHTIQTVSVVGRLISYDAASHDIALVAIPCPLPIEPVPVAPEALVLQTGDQVFSLGCDQGASPSIRPTSLKAVTRYSGIAKYDIVGRPTDGRSGGGLFTLGGQLVGVCNAAAVEIDEGIYTGLESVYWQFASANLTHLFRPQGTPEHRQAEVQSVNNTVTANPALISASTELLPGTTDVGIQHAIFRGDTPPARNAGLANPNSSMAQASSPNSATELIVVIRYGNQADDKTFTVQNPDPAMIRDLVNASQASDEHEAVERLANLPDLEPATRESIIIRTQSPR